MTLRTAILLLALPVSVAATSPPIDIPFEQKVCRASHIFVGTASDFAVVADPSCPHRGDGRYLTMCEEVQVSVSVSQSARPLGWQPTDRVVFRFGGGLFSVDALRKDLLGKPRYFFTVQAADGVHRTSHGWYLGAEFNAETEKLVNEALGKCVGANSSFKPSPLRGPA